MVYFDAKEFGKRLQSARKLRKLTQGELAERVGLSNSQHISRIERGEKVCSIDLLVELAFVLDVSTDYLLTGKQPGVEHIKDELQSVIERLSTIAEGI